MANAPASFPFPFDAPRTVLQLLRRDVPVPPIGTADGPGGQVAQHQKLGSAAGGGGGGGGRRREEEGEDEDDEGSDDVAGRGAVQEDEDEAADGGGGAEMMGSGGRGGRRDSRAAGAAAADAEAGGKAGGEREVEEEQEEEDAVRLAERTARALAAANVGSALLAEQMGWAGRAAKRPRSGGSGGDSGASGAASCPLLFNGADGLQVVSAGDAAAAARLGLAAPPGFTSVRQYPSYRHPGRTTRYVCTVGCVSRAVGGLGGSSGGGGDGGAAAGGLLRFRVAAEDDPGGAVMAASPSEAWQEVAMRAHASQRAHDAAKAAERGAPRSGAPGPTPPPPPPPRPVLVASGPDLFGLTHPVVREALMRGQEEEVRLQKEEGGVVDEKWL